MQQQMREEVLDVKPLQGAPIGLTAPIALGAMPVGQRMSTRDDGVAHAPLRTVFNIVRAVERWPEHLAHYRWVKMLTRDAQGGGVVEMSANRPFGPLNWPTFWRSLMEVDHARPAVRFKHIGGVTKGMDVDWSFQSIDKGRRTYISLIHEWDGPAFFWPEIGAVAARKVIGPVFVHAIAARTLNGLARTAERAAI